MAKDKADNGAEPSPFETMVQTSAPSTTMAEVEEDAVPAVSTTWMQEPTFEPNEIGFPRLRLGQGLTPEVAERQADMGDWILSGYEPLKEATIIPLMVGRTRFKRKDPSERESPVGCQSPDGIVGYGDPGGSCKGCVFAKWQPGGPNGKNLPPACTITYRYAVFVVEHETVAEVVFQRTSEQYAYFINNLQQRYKFGNFALRLTSTTKSNGARRWAEPQLKLAPLTARMRAAAGNLLPGNEPSWPEEAPEDAEVVDSQAVAF